MPITDVDAVGMFDLYNWLMQPLMTISGIGYFLCGMMSVISAVPSTQEMFGFLLS